MDIEDDNLLMPLIRGHNKAGKNTNPEIYFQDPKYKNRCVVCDAKTTDKLVTSHYLRNHSDLEVYTSRLSAEFAGKAVGEPSPPQYENTTKGSQLKAICYFCGDEKKFGIQYWSRHILSHTGEYEIRCETCNQSIGQESYHRSKCSSYKPRKLFEFSVEDGYLWAFMCKSCNYVQVRRKNMESHLKKEHQMTDANLEIYYNHIKLISNRMCAPMADVKEEIVQMHENYSGNASPSSDESSNEMPTETEESNPDITLKIKSEHMQCVDEEVNIGYAHLDHTEELLSSSICQRLAQEPDSDQTLEPDETSLAVRKRVKTERFDGTYLRFQNPLHAPYATNSIQFFCFFPIFSIADRKPKTRTNYAHYKYSNELICQPFKTVKRNVRNS